MRRERAWLKFQRFCVELLPHQGYRRVRHGPPEGDGGADGVAVRPDLQPCFASVSFRWSPAKLIEDVTQWTNEHTGERADVVVFMVWHNPRQKTISNLAREVQSRFGLKLEVINESTILATATREEAWRWTCACLGIPHEGELDPQRAAELRAKYSEWLIRNYGNIDFAGFLPGVVPYGKPLFLPLEEIFVSLKVRETFERTIPKAELEAEKELPPQEAQPAGRPQDFDVDFEELYGRERKREEARILDVGEALANNPKAVILGDPGAGKSTLLKYIALAYARRSEAVRERLGLSEDRTPILVSVAAFSESYKQHKTGLLPFIQKDVTNAGLDPDTAQVLSNDIEAGRAVILFDGLDEVLTISMRLQIVRQIQGFIAAHPKNRYIASCRTFAYSIVPIGPDFTEVTLEPFDDPAIESFSEKWSIALEKFSRGDSPDALQRAESEARNLHQAILSKPGVRSLARNPLMLTILSLIHRQGKKMPSRRIELYALCTKTLIESWCLTRDIAGVPAGQALDERDTLDVLCPVAFRMHCDYPSGVIPGKELRKLVIKAMVDVRGMDERGAEREAESLLNVVQKQSGLIARRGADTYSFLHMTFQEYLAGRYVASQRAAIWKRLRPVLHHPRWREVVLLTAGCLGILMEDRESCERLVSQIRTAGSPLEETIHRDILLSLECLCDNLKISPGVELPIAQDALERLNATRSTAFLHRLSTLLAHQPAGPLRALVLRVVIGGLQHPLASVRWAAGLTLSRVTQAGDQAAEAVLDALSRSSHQARSAAIAALGRFPWTSAPLIRYMKDSLKDPESSVRSAAAAALGKLATHSRQALQWLQDALTDGSGYVRSAAVAALAKPGPASRPVLQLLRRSLDDPNPRVRAAAASGLGRWARSVSPAGDPLPQRLTDPDARVRCAAMIAVARSRRPPPAVTRALLESLRDSNHAVRASAAVALGLLGDGSPETVGALEARLQDTNATVRCDAAVALARLGAATPAGVERLREALKDPNPNVRSAVITALARLARNGQDVIQWLGPSLAQQDPPSRSAAIAAFGSWVPRSPEVTQWLTGTLEHPQPCLRCAAAAALNKRGHAGPEVLGCLREGHDDPDWGVRNLAALAEIITDETRPGALVALRRSFKEDTVCWVANTAYEALLRIAAKMDTEKYGEPVPCE